jgi:hypothetical protein
LCKYALFLKIVLDSMVIRLYILCFPVRVW